MTVLESVSHRSIQGDGRVNEDLAGGTADMLWVLDGATGLGPSRIATTTDAAWFVHAIDAALRDGDDAGPLTDILAAAVARVARRWQANAGPTTEDWHAPSAAIALLRVRPGAVDLLSLGDCRIVYRRGGTLESFGADDVGPHEARNLAALAALYQADPLLSPADARRRIDPLLRDTRMLMNMAGGYWVLGLDPAPIANARTATIALDPGETLDVMIASDGYLRLTEMYGAASLADLLDDRDVDARLDQLRAIEAEDADCRRYPRFKRGDDATVLHASAVNPA